MDPLGMTDRLLGEDSVERDTVIAQATRARPALRRRFLRDPTVRLGLVILLPLAALALFGPALAPSDPRSTGGPALQAPSWEHPFGTDRAGRDLLSRVMAGARLSLVTAVVVSSLTMVVGIALGMVSGYFGGWVDSVLSRILEIVLAFPGLLLALAIAALLEPGIGSLIVALVSVGWAGHARVARGLALILRERPFVEAARAVGCRPPRVLARHMLPNVLPPVVVLATLEMGNVILTLSALSFLGLGPQPPTPEWGAMVNDGRSFFSTSPHLMLFPGLAITAAVLGFNLLGDGLRDVMDPKADRYRW